VDAARILAGGEESLDGGPARGVDDHPAHHEVRRRAHLDRLAGQIPAEVAAAPDHAPEVGLDELRAQVRHIDPHAAVRAAEALLHLGEAGARDEVARGAFHAPRVVARHEAFALAVEQPAPGPPEPLFQQRAGHERVGHDQARGMELHHLHVLDGGAGAQRQRDAVGGLVRRAGDDAVHRRPAAHREEGGAAAHRGEAPPPDVEQERPADAAGAVAEQLDGTVLLEGADRPANPHLLGEPVHDLDAGQISLVNGPVVRLAGEGLLVDAAVGVPVEKAAVATFQLQHAPRRLGDESPDELLVVDPAAARQGVEEVRIEGVGRGEHGVVAALDHPRAAGAAEQPFDDDGHRQVRRAVRGVQSRAEPGAAGAQDQEIGLEDVDGALRGDYSPGPGRGAIRRGALSGRAP